MLSCFVCASPLYKDDPDRDKTLHVSYLDAHIKSCPPHWVELSVIQNGCEFPTGTTNFIRNPFPKNIAYNWLLCDANCHKDYWLFLPEDCLISSKGWLEIRKRIERGVTCFGLSKDPKALVGRRGTFAEIPTDIQALCDMNFLGKEIAGAVLRGELEKAGFHCITKHWKRISDTPKRWGNELYEEINPYDNLDSNTSLARPIFQDYGLDGWKAPREVIEETFMKIVEKSLGDLRDAADRAKQVVSHYGPLITELPYKGILKRLVSHFKSS